MRSFQRIECSSPWFGVESYHHRKNCADCTGQESRRYQKHTKQDHLIGSFFHSVKSTLDLARYFRLMESKKPRYGLSPISRAESMTHSPQSLQVLLHVPTLAAIY